MATYEYLCIADGCQAITERIQPMSEDRPATIPCKFCGESAAFKISLPSIMRSGMTASKTPADIAIGRDADARWSSIADRQAQRNKVRVETQTAGLAATGYTTFEPIKTGQRLNRMKALNAVEKMGYKPDGPDPA